MYSRNQFKEINAVIYNFKNFNIFYFFNYLNIWFYRDEEYYFYFLTSIHSWTSLFSFQYLFTYQLVFFLPKNELTKFKKIEKEIGK